MKRFRTWIVFSALIGSPLIASAAPLKTTAGSFAVSPRGEATYSIGIQVPPGIAGIEPALTLMYSSDSGNGRLGVDWNLGGTSEIHRCPQTLAQDGAVRAVSMDASDRLCLDGIRLVVVGGGTYGAEGTEYRTETDGFTKIIAHTSVGNGPSVSNGPAWFEVWTKAGQYKTYGNSTDSRVIALGVSPTTARVWALNRVQDALTNYMTYTYTQDSVNGDYYPAQINYTGNTTIAQATTSQVTFTWAARPDPVVVYQGGAKINGVVRLTDVKTYIAAGATLVRDYKILYNVSSATGRSEVSSLTECVSSGACFPPISFAWTNHVKGMIDKGAAISGTSYANFQTSNRIFVADVNGDGISDIVLGPDTSGNWYVMLGTGTGFTDQHAWATGLHADVANAADGIRIMDVNGDGLADIEMGPDANGNWYVMLSTGHSFVDGGAWATGKYPGMATARNRIYTIDVNGDGLEDLVFGPDSLGNWNVLQSTGTSFVDKGAFITGAYANWISAQGRTFIADVNGDGLQDIVLGPDGSGNWYVLRSTGTAFVDDGAWITGAHADWVTATSGIHAMDVNGDGLSDIEMGPDASGNWYVMMSTGKKFVDSQWATGLYANWNSIRYRIYPTDTNGDGLQDILLGPDTSGNWFVLRSTGSKFVDDGVVSCCAYTSTFANANLVFAADVNGDGLRDIVIGPDGSGNWYHIDSNPANERITGVNDGLATTSWTYAPLTRSSVYTRDSGANAAVYPIMDLQFPAYVVSSVNSPNGIGGVLTTNYTYGGFKTDLTGRGILGPRWTNATRAAVGSFAARTTYTEFNQTYPLNGLVSKSQDVVAGGGNGGVLSEIDNTYKCYSGSGSPVPTINNCTLSAGLRYFPYLYQSVQTRWDLNGAAFPTTTSTSTYDNWSNATQIVSSTTDGYTKTTNNSYLAANTSSWILGRLSNASVTSTSPQTVPGYLLTTPANLTATAVSAKQVNLGWSASSDTGGVGIAGYHVYRGGALIASTTSLTYSDTTTIALSPYTYTVAAYDVGGAISSPSNAASVTTPGYPLPSAPTGLGAIALSPTSVQLTWTAGADAGGPGISGYKIYRGGTQINTSATTNFTDNTAVANTTYTYTVAEYDTSGNPSAQSAGAMVTTPSVADTTPPTAPGVPTFSSITMTTATASWTAATDNVGVTSYEYQVNGSAWTNIGNALAVGLTGLHPSTSYTVAVHAKDAAGNIGTASSAAFTSAADTTPPSAPGAITMSSIAVTSATASWGAATDNVGVTSYEYQLNSGSWVNVGNVLTKGITGLTAGTSYTIAVHAKDAAGNAGASSSTSFSTPTITDSPAMTEGTNTIGHLFGFVSGAFGSMSPATTSNGFTYQAYRDQYVGGHGGSYSNTSFIVSGFSADPGISWLVSLAGGGQGFTGAAATYSYSAGTATWKWTTGGSLSVAGTVTCSVVHK